MWFNRPTTDRNYSGEQKVSFESPVPFSKCLRAKICCNMNVHFDPQGCQTLLLKESEPFLLSLGSWTSGFKANYNEVLILMSVFSPSVICLQETFLKQSDNVSFRDFNMFNYICPDGQRA